MPPLTWYPYALRNWYPHMAATDSPIWTRYIINNPAAFDSVAYDVAVGDGAAFGTVVNLATGGDVARLYQRRIDVVGVKDGKYTIVEVKMRASTSAIGQARGYAKLFALDYPEHTLAGTLIITDMMLPNMEFLAKDEGVSLVVA